MLTLSPNVNHLSFGFFLKSILIRVHSREFAAKKIFPFLLS